MATRLVLWDIDHTLVDTRGFGWALFAEAFHQVTGVALERQPRIGGMTEPVIFRETARLHGLSTTREEFDAFAPVLAELHLRHAAELRERGHALPGAASVLAALGRVPGVRQTVLTGNIRATAHVKVAAYGLDRHLDLGIGAYGEESEDRAELVTLALDRAGCPASEAVLVGDTPGDVRAGLAGGVRVVAVATGRCGREELRSAGAEVVVPDLSAHEDIVQLIMDGHRDGRAGAVRQRSR
ncbi:HAD family hydrolase [Streptomyces luteoverticillatus]|uniref:HAD family hydrolase n=1 Tax=Streptomyces luteoverticillatus TaxID=66425 RepID=A0A3Q9G1X3_STRLT|nr:HAD family hydrolase [Streptomyces luteoverticillatus]AZQ74102.1 HAD family hydrolase [Streptomyces luteoverticillatus]